MPVISLFEHSLKLELAILELEKHHIRREMILAKSINKNSIEKKYLDPYNADGLNLFLASSIGMIVMLLGAIYGFTLYIGPVLCGLIGLICGVLIGLFLDFIFKKRVRKKTIKKNRNDVILIVTCDESKVELVEEILIKHQTLGIVKL